MAIDKKIEIQFKHRVTRLDFHDAVVHALLEELPTLENNGHIQDFYARQQKSEKEITKLKDRIARLEEDKSDDKSQKN